MHDPIAVYVPKRDGESGHPPLTFPAGAGIAGSPAPDWLGGDETDKLIVDYEEGRASNVVTYADRVYHAADRHCAHYPTHRRMLVAADRLIRVGTYHPGEGRVEIDETSVPRGQALYRLAEWIGMPLPDKGKGTGGLHEQLRATHAAVRR